MSIEHNLSLWMASLKSQSFNSFKILTIFSTSGISFDPLECFKLSCFSNIILVLRAQILLTKNYTKYFLPSLPFGSNI